jgi:four helix bundle protein
MTIKTFKELEAYQLAFELQQLIFEQSKRFPKEETYSLTDQIRRSSRSVGANIAEAWRKRRYPAHFTSKLTDADGENAETQHWLDTAQACHYLSDEIRDDLIEKSMKVGAMLGRMMADPVKWQPR